jgi:uncharacterized membrane protein YhaH (DUF805 family)
MDFGKLFFSAYGRIGRQEFWVGWVILWMVGLFTMLIPLINSIAWIPLLYCGVCIRSKRLHDMGRTGWLQVVPVIACIVFWVIVFWAILGAVFGAALMGEASAPGIALGVMGVVMAGLIAWLIDIGFLIWIGVSDRDPYDNLYGPGPADDYQRGAVAA